MKLSSPAIPSLILVLSIWAGWAKGCHTSWPEPTFTSLPVEEITVVASPSLASIVTSTSTPLLPRSPSPIATPSQMSAATDTILASSSSRPAVTPTLTPAREPGGTIIIGIVGEIRVLHPLLARTTAERQIVPIIWESLARMDPETGALQPGLASGWSIAEDNLAITWELRTDILWSDGRPLEPADVLATFEYIRSGRVRSLYQAGMNGLDHIEQSGERHIRMYLRQPACSSLYDLGLIPIVPRNVLLLPDADFAEGPAIPATGAFALSGKVVAAQLVRLVRNAHARPPATLDAVEIKTYESDRELRMALEKGEIDVAYLPPDVSEPLSISSSGQLYTFPGDELVFAYFNTRAARLSTNEIRRALTMAVNREMMVRQLGIVGATPLSSPLLPSHWAADPLQQPPVYDPDQANELLSRAGWMDADGDGIRSRVGQSLVINLLANGENHLRATTASLLAASYRAIGIASEVHLVEWGVFLDRLFRHDYDVAVMSWHMPVDPDHRMFWSSAEGELGRGFNFSQWGHEEADRLLDSLANAPGCRPAERSEIAHQLAELMRKDLPIDPLYAPHAQLAVRGDNIVGPAPGPFASPFWDIREWHFTRR